MKKKPHDEQCGPSDIQCRPYRIDKRFVFLSGEKLSDVRERQLYSSYKYGPQQEADGSDIQHELHIIIFRQDGPVMMDCRS